MKKIFTLFLFTCLMLPVSQTWAALNVFACEPEWKALVDALGKERVNSFSATTAFQDPHHIEARPSLIAKVRRADLVICSGAELETGWLPLLLRQAGNAKVLPGKTGYFEAATFVARLEVRADVDRSMGDVHASGNPHVHLDPRRIAKIALALSMRLAELDPQGKATYQNYFNDFAPRWRNAIQKWQQQAQPLRGISVITHHKDWIYLFDWLGIKLQGTLEPKPGLPTSAGHLLKLKKLSQSTPIKMIIYSAYQNPRAAQRLAQMTSLPVVELPYTVGGAEQAKDLFGLFDITIQRLINATESAK